MRTEVIEVYSDAANGAVLRHPGRRFPGVLVQGDSLFILVDSLARVLEDESLSELARDELCELHTQLSALLEHYKQVLGEHKSELPFRE